MLVHKKAQVQNFIFGSSSIAVCYFNLNFENQLVLLLKAKLTRCSKLISVGYVIMNPFNFRQFLAPEVNSHSLQCNFLWFVSLSQVQMDISLFTQAMLL